MKKAAARKKPAPKAKPAAKKTAAKKSAPAPFLSTGFWLLKSEPESYSIDKFRVDAKTLWTGVRNYQARNFMMTSMKRGDVFLFYHSNAEPPAVVGVGEITRIAVPDPSALDDASEYFDPKASPDHPIWFCAEVAYRGHLAKPVRLDAIRDEPGLAKMPLLARGQRLSVQPVTAEEYDLILKMGGGLE